MKNILKNLNTKNVTVVLGIAGKVMTSESVCVCVAM